MVDPFWKSPTYRIIQAMKATGNQSGVVAQWKDAVAKWAQINRTLPEAQAVNAWLPFWQPRPFYNGQELAPIWPALAVALGIVERPFPVISPARLRFMLDYGALPTLRKPDGDGYFRDPQTGIEHRYFIVERVHYWRDLPLTQEEFENALAG